MANAYRIAVDWDGTLVVPNWPKAAEEWMPGAVEAMRELHEQGCQLIINTLRLNPYNPATSQSRGVHELMNEEGAIRSMLDNAGLTFVQIWTLPGKVPADLYIDDRAMYYPGTPRSWAAVTRKALAWADKDAEFPHFDFEVANGGT